MSNMLIVTADSDTRYNDDILIPRREDIEWNDGDKIGSTAFTKNTRENFNVTIKVKDEYSDFWEIEYILVNGLCPLNIGTLATPYPNCYKDDPVKCFVGNSISALVAPYSNSCIAQIHVFLRRKVVNLDVELSSSHDLLVPTNEWSVELSNRALGTIRYKQIYGEHFKDQNNVRRKTYHLYKASMLSHIGVNYSVNIKPNPQPKGNSMNARVDKDYQNRVFDIEDWNNSEHKMGMFMNKSKKIRYEYYDVFKLVSITVYYIDSSSQLFTKTVKPEDVDILCRLRTTKTGDLLKFRLNFNKKVNMVSFNEYFELSDMHGIRPANESGNRNRLDCRELMDYKRTGKIRSYQLIGSELPEYASGSSVEVNVDDVCWGNNLQMSFSGISAVDGSKIDNNGCVFMQIIGPRLIYRLKKIRLKRLYDGGKPWLGTCEDVNLADLYILFNGISKLGNNHLYETYSGVRFPLGSNYYDYTANVCNTNGKLTSSDLDKEVDQNLFMFARRITEFDQVIYLSAQAFDNDWNSTTQELQDIAKGVISEAAKLLGDSAGVPDILGKTFTIISKENDWFTDDEIGSANTYLTHGGATDGINKPCWGIPDCNDLIRAFEVEVGNDLIIWLEVDFER